MFKTGLTSFCIYGLLLHCTWEGAFYGCEHGEAVEQTFVQIDVPTFQHLF
jgi:hypothetical protein